MERLNLAEDVSAAATVLQQLQPLATNEILRHGLIMTPARGNAGAVSEKRGGIHVKGVALGPSGNDLAHGFEEVLQFIRSEIYRDAE